MFLRVTTIFLLSIEYILATGNSTTEHSFKLPALSTSIGNTTTRKTEITEVQKTSNHITDNLLIASNASNQESTNAEQKQNEYNFLRPRGKTKFIFENIVQASGINEVLRNETKNQHQSYSIPTPIPSHQELEDLEEQQQLQLATLKKEQFIQSELHNLAKDIAQTELNHEAGKTNSNSRPTSWKSFFSNIFPQGILNVFHLSVTTEPQKSTNPPKIQEGRFFGPNDKYQSKRTITEWSTLPITSPLPTAPPLSVDLSPSPTPMPTLESEVPLETSDTTNKEPNAKGSLMTNKDVYDINGAAEGSELPIDVIVPMESSNVFRIHPLNCEDNCGEESEDYVDQLSETGDGDNVVAFSREAPKNIFYPTPKPSPPYGELNKIQNSDVFYTGSEMQTSEEIIRENTKDFGQKIPYHPAKELDDFQQEVEKQFDHNEVRIDSEAASRKFLKHFKGKYVKPQQSSLGMQFSTTTLKNLNDFQLLASTLRPELVFPGQPGPLNPESHGYVFSPGFNSDSKQNEPPKNVMMVQPRGGKADNPNDPPSGQQSLDNKPLPYPNVVRPLNLLHTYIFSMQDNNNSIVLNPGPETSKPPPEAIISSWIAPKSDTKDSAGNRLYTNVYPLSFDDDKVFQGYKAPIDKPQNGTNDNENNVQNQIEVEKPAKSYEVYSTNLKPESLLHTYIYSTFDKGNNNSGSGGTGMTEASFPPWITSQPEKYSQPSSSATAGPTERTYICPSKNGADCSYSTTLPSDSFYQQKDLIQVQKSLEQPVKHTKPYVYYNYPPGPPLLSNNPIRVAQMEDSQQSESLVMPESYQQRQQYLQDQQKQLNQQQEYYQEQQIQQYQQKLQYQQLQQYQQEQQKQRDQMQKQQEQLQQYQQKEQQQLQQYQQAQQAEQQEQMQKKQMQQYQQVQQQQQQQLQKQLLQQFQQVQQQQRDQQQLQKQQQQQQLLQQYQQEQQLQKDQQQQQLQQMMMKQMMKEQMDQQEKQQEKQQQEQQEKQQKLIQYKTVKVEKVVPKPYPVPVKEFVEKIVERPYPVERIVEKPVHVPYPVREVVEKIVDRPYPVEKIIDRPVHVPYPVQVDHFIDRPYPVKVPVAVPVPVHQYIDRPYPVEKIIEKPIHVPYPVDKIVEKIVEKHIPVERIVEKPAPKKPAPKKSTPLPESRDILKATAARVAAYKNKNKINLEELLELVPPPADQEDHESYKTIPDDIEFIFLDDYNGPVPLDHKGYQFNKPEKRAAKNHNIKRSPEFRRNLRVEYGFRPPLIPSVEIGEKGLI